MNPDDFVTDEEAFERELALCGPVCGNRIRKTGGDEPEFR